MASLMTHLEPDRRACLAEIDPVRRGMGLFAHFNDVCYFMKDREGRFVDVNDACVLLLGRQSREDVIGQTDWDVNPRNLAELYTRDDQVVFETGRPLVNKVELVPRSDLAVQWYTTTKIPLFDRDGYVIGLEGMTRPQAVGSGISNPYPEMHKAIEFVETHYGERIQMADLANAAGMAQRTFERHFKQRFEITPNAYLRKVRVNAACRELIRGDTPITQIAVDCGFYDQSHMTKEFVKMLAVTPQAYREKHTP